MDTCEGALTFRPCAQHVNTENTSIILDKALFIFQISHYNYFSINYINTTNSFPDAWTTVAGDFCSYALESVVPVALQH